MDLSIIKQQFENQPGIEFQMRCGFCNGLEEATGQLGMEITPGNFAELPIGPECLEKVHQQKHVQWVDKPADMV